MTNPLNSYINLARIVFSVEPTEPNAIWDDFVEFEEKLRELYKNLLCKNCNQLLEDPCTPKKHYFSCHHRVCLDCIGKNRTTTLNCKMCRDFTLFEKSSQTKIVLRLYKELCELIKGSWIYNYVLNHDTGQENDIRLNEIIENGINYGESNSLAFAEESSSDESSLVHPIHIKNEESTQIVPYQMQSQQQPTFPTISPLQPIPAIVQSPDQFTIQPSLPQGVVESIPSPPLPIQVTTAVAPIAPHNKITIPNQAPLLKASPFISHVPMRVKPMVCQQTTQITTTKSIMSPMKIQQQPVPTIYSVMYSGSGNKITLKRKAPDDNVSIPITSDISSTSNNTTFVKTESFKAPTVQIATQQIPIVVPTTSNLNSPQITTQSSTSSTMSSAMLNTNPNEPQKRRGCRCGNATAAPGKLTCCGQRCPCYVDSKACIDCKCKGCRNPHYVDGHKKMRHQVPDLQTQQQQQQNFLASVAMLKEAQKSAVAALTATTTTTMIKSEEMSLVEPTSIAKSQNSINNCIISMNSNGQYQIKPRIIMKEPVKATMSPLIFPTTSTGQLGNSNSSIQIVGLYSQVPMANDKKIIIKNELQTTGSVVSFTADSSKQHLLDSSTQFTTNNLNTGML